MGNNGRKVQNAVVYETRYLPDERNEYELHASEFKLSVSEIRCRFSVQDTLYSGILEAN